MHVEVEDEVIYQQQGAILNWSVLVSYVSSNLPSQVGSSYAAVTRILLTISSGHLELLSKLAGMTVPVKVSTWNGERDVRRLNYNEVSVCK